MSSSSCSSWCSSSSSASSPISASPAPFPSTSKFKPILTIAPHATTTTIPKMSLKPRDFHNPAPQPPSSSSSSLLTALSALLFGPSLPPGLLVSSVRSAWTAAWRVMMSQLAPSDPSGRYARPASRFRLAGPVAPRPGGLHLYVGLPCPWAHRALVVRALKGLEEAVPVSVASPGADGSWEFRDPPGPGPERGDLVPGRDKANKRRNLREVYGLRRGGYSGRCTVPMLWDVDRSDVACNESYDIIKVFNSGLNGLARNPEVDLSPPELEAEIEEWNRVIYPGVNNGVYRCGFAQSQEAYDAAVDELFGTLDRLEDRLSRSRYLCGSRLTLADVCLFTTLVRFDLVYNVLFKCTKKKLVEYPNLHGYMRDIYQVPKVAATCDFDAIMDGYYRFLFPLNPGNIKPAMPAAFAHDALFEPHDRARLSSQSRGTLVNT
ncbi:glutathionyl-hydroquinone reductase YqjG-like [Rhodamnia argentea]|uniref:Glutathionyl-hydroquinone reductase YqjG-like n=1 Tax=Rhodamnia argentea TaxID=178133 RepID=A0ABM3HMS8_9MYRT|nr:glutathionyl-hydroquinone reductase YqjG-like [Rhodamnia argentea]